MDYPHNYDLDNSIENQFSSQYGNTKLFYNNFFYQSEPRVNDDLFGFVYNQDYYHRLMPREEGEDYWNSYQVNEINNYNFSCNTNVEDQKFNIATLCSDENTCNEEYVKITSEELIEFANKFKQVRIRNGYTQADVGNSLGNLYGTFLSQTTVCRFESLQLSSKNMCKLKPLMEKWIKEITFNNVDFNGSENQFIFGSKRKKRTPIDSSVKYMLEKYFSQNQKPGSLIIRQIANTLKLDKDVIRVWFCNRRQKEKRNVYNHSLPDESNYSLDHQFSKTREDPLYYGMNGHV